MRSSLNTLALAGALLTAPNTAEAKKPCERTVHSEIANAIQDARARFAAETLQAPEFKIVRTSEVKNFSTQELDVCEDKKALSYLDGRWPVDRIDSDEDLKVGEVHTFFILASIPPNQRLDLDIVAVFSNGTEKSLSSVDAVEGARFRIAPIKFGVSEELRGHGVNLQIRNRATGEVLGSEEFSIEG